MDLETTAPTMMGQEGFTPGTALYVLPVRKPTNAEKAALVAEQKKLGLMMPVPWAGNADFAIEIEYAVKNLDNTPNQAFLTVVGGNEFGDYVQAAYVNASEDPEDQVAPPPLLQDQPINLAANAVHEGVFREDQIHTSGIDLEAITRYPDPADVFDTPFEAITHDPSISDIGFQNIPKNDVTPAMVRFLFTINATGHVAVDYTVRVRDFNDKLASPTAKNLYVSTVAVLPPPVMPMQPVVPPKTTGQ